MQIDNNDILKALETLVSSYKCLLEIHLSNPQETKGYNNAIMHVLLDLEDIMRDLREGIEWDVNVIRMCSTIH